MTRRWSVGAAPRPGTRVRLLCFPFAGGSGSAYLRWARAAPPGLHVEGVDYPGHGVRMAEEPERSMRALVDGLVPLVTPLLDAPVAFLGHSMGGVVAYELAVALRDRGLPPPVHLVVSACGLPGTPVGRTSLAGLSDVEVVEELRRLGGTPGVLLEHPDVVRQAVRVLRADSALLGGHVGPRHAPLDVPVTALAGRDDEVVPAHRVRVWSAVTTGGFTFRTFAGDHFFVLSAAAQVLDVVAEAVLRPVAGPVGEAARTRVEDEVGAAPRTGGGR